MNSLLIAGALVLAACHFVPLHAQDLPNPKAVYDAHCAACHATGAAGAPRTGDAAAWSARIDAGINTLYANAIKGKGAMPPKGGSVSLTDAQVMAAVNHIVGQTAVPGATSSARRSSAKPAETVKANAPAMPDTTKGKLVYQTACAACHTTGLAGAPRLGDVSAWGPRIGAGPGALYTGAIKGIRGMPPKGGNASLPDADVRAAVDYMLAQVRSQTAAPAPAAPVSPPPAVAVAALPKSSVDMPAGPVVQEPDDPNAFNRLMLAPGRRNAPPAEDGIHDPVSPGTSLLQAPARSFQSLPRGNFGNYVDWVAALARKLIQPRWDVKDPNAAATVMDLNIVREVKGTMPDVVYPHKQHTEWLDCSNCHPAIFIPQKGANQISMAAIMLGQKCGVCHGKVAFPVSECRLCHSRNKDASARAAAGTASGAVK